MGERKGRRNVATAKPKPHGKVTRPSTRDERMARFLKWAARRGLKLESGDAVRLERAAPGLPPPPPSGRNPQPHDPDDFLLVDVDEEGTYFRLTRPNPLRGIESGPWADLEPEGDPSKAGNADGGVRAFLGYFGCTKFEWAHLPSSDRLAIRDALRTIVPVLEDVMRFAIDPGMGWGEEVLQQSGIRLLTYLARRLNKVGAQKGSFQNRLRARAHWKKGRWIAQAVTAIFKDIKTKKAVQLSRPGGQEGLAAEANKRLLARLGPGAELCLPSDMKRLQTQAPLDAAGRLLKALGVAQDVAGRRRTRARVKPPLGNQPAR